MDATPVRLDPTETPLDIGGAGDGGFSMKPERARGAAGAWRRGRLAHSEAPLRSGVALTPRAPHRRRPADKLAHKLGKQAGQSLRHRAGCADACRAAAVAVCALRRAAAFSGAVADDARPTSRRLMGVPGRSPLGVPSPITKRVPGTPGSAGLAAGARTPLSDAARKYLASKAAQAVRCGGCSAPRASPPRQRRRLPNHASLAGIERPSLHCAFGAG